MTDTQFDELLTAAAEAEELFSLDELERFADEQRELERKRDDLAKLQARTKLIALYTKKRWQIERNVGKFDYIRPPYLTAQNCLREVKYELEYRDKYDWDYPGRSNKDHDLLRTVEIERGPMKFVAEIYADDAGIRDDDLGVFTNCPFSDWEDRNDSRPSREAVWVDFGPSKDEQGWYESSYTYKERMVDYAHLGRQLAHETARLMIRREAKRFADYYRDNWQYVGVKTTLYVGDIELGDESLWGIDWDGDNNEYINQTVDEQIGHLYYSALEYIEEQCKAHLEKFVDLMNAADTCLTANKQERNEWIETMIDYTVALKDRLPKTTAL